MSLAHLPMDPADVFEWDDPADAGVELSIDDELIEGPSLLVVRTVRTLQSLLPRPVVAKVCLLYTSPSPRD